MRLSWGLVCSILLYLENAEESVYTHDVEVIGTAPNIIAEHVSLLVQGSLLEVIDARSMQHPHRYLIQGITLEGHNLLAILRKPKVWSIVQKMAQDAGISLTASTIAILGEKAISRLTENI